MSRITDYILEQEDAGELIYVEGRGYIKPEDYAHEYMKTKPFKEEFDKAFKKEEVKEWT
jgi:hypothetical protein